MKINRVLTKVIFTLFIFLLFCFIRQVSVFSQIPNNISPESVGFSTSRLNRINATIQNHIDKGEIPGAVTYIARHGKIVHFEAFGMMDIEKAKPMTKDAIFRIASMKKLITSIAAMILYEEGHFLLNDPVSKYIPEFKEMKVAVFDNTNSTILKMVQAKNSITIHDLLRHTSGLVYPGRNPAMDKLLENANLDMRTTGLPFFIKELSSLPLAFEPGEKWEYGFSLDVIAYLIEVVTGKSFDEFCQERIYKPLKLESTGDYIPKSKLNKFTTLYRAKNGQLIPYDSPENTIYKDPPKGSPGGGWFLSSVMDFSKICQLLLNNGRIDGVQILGRKTIELMFTNQLGEYPVHRDRWYKPHAGFGIGGAVLEDLGISGELGSEGMFWWAGSHNTHFFIDPQEQLVGIIMFQVSPMKYLDLMLRFKNLCYQALIGK